MTKRQRRTFSSGFKVDAASLAIDYAKATLREQIAPLDVVLDTLGGEVQQSS